MDLFSFVHNLCELTGLPLPPTDLKLKAIAKIQRSNAAQASKFGPQLSTQSCECGSGCLKHLKSGRVGQARSSEGREGRQTESPSCCQQTAGTRGCHRGSATTSAVASWCIAPLLKNAQDASSRDVDLGNVDVEFLNYKASLGKETNGNLQQLAAMRSCCCTLSTASGLLHVKEKAGAWSELAFCCRVSS